MIYTDGVHLISDNNLDELHKFAITIGLKRHFYEGLRKNHPHYDLTNKTILEKALTAGAIPIKPFWSFSSKRKIAQLVSKCINKKPSF